jgi:predicted permease
MKLGPHWLREHRFWRRPADRDVDDELAFHLAMRAELLEDAGLDPRTARDTALQRFGDLAEVREQCITLSHERERRMKRLETWSAIRQHVRFALRRLAAAPGFAVAVLLMLALGVGATTTVFCVVDGILLRPLPFDQPERLVDLTHSIAIAGRSTIDQSDGTFLLYQRYARASFENMGAWRTRGANLGMPGGSDGDAERVAATGVTAGFFPTLRATALRGRTFKPGDDRPGAPRVMVISDALWRRKFGGDPAIVGRRLVVDGSEREVIGVMPGDFHYPDASTSMWFPLAFDPAQANPASFNFHVVARLRPGVDRNMAAAELDRYLPRLLDEFPADIPREMWEQAHVRPVVTPLRDAVVGNVGRLLWILLGAVGLLLFIACANVASLFLVRAEGARRDLAIRLALGAGRRAVLAQYLSEALVLAVGGGVLGVLLAVVGVHALRLSPAGANLPRLAEVSVDGRVLLFAIGVTTLSAVAVSLLPMLRSRRVAPGIVLKEASRSATTGRDRQRARSTLVVAQVALALVLVSGSALMARSFARLRDVQPGFDARNVLTVRVALSGASYAPAAARLRFFERALADIRAIPGVRNVAVADWVPLTDDHNDSVVQIEDQPLPSGAVPPDLPLTFVSADYFATFGIPLISGRTFDRPDITRPSDEVIVSRSLAEHYWKGTSPIGKRLRASLSGPWFTIVGVVGDVHMQSLELPAEELVYFPIVRIDENGRDADVPTGVALAIRTTGDPTAISPALRSVFRTIDPALPTYDERPMAARLAESTARARFVMLMLGVASLVALVIGMVGLYGVLAYGVTLRRREIGVRMALGASALDVTRMVARRGIVLALLGVSVGLLGALAATRVLHGLLYGVSPTDPVALVATCVTLFAVAALASWLPARQAAAIPPMEALRRD